jgi:phage-related protein
VAYKCLYLARVLKTVLWLGSTRRDVRSFPKDARRWAGYELYRVQQGLDPTDSKAMGSVGIGVREIRVHTELEHRVLYVAKFEEGVCVLHAFEKRSRKTNRDDIALARRRFREFVREQNRVRALRRE